MYEPNTNEDGLRTGGVDINEYDKDKERILEEDYGGEKPIIWRTQERDLTFEATPGPWLSDQYLIGKEYAERASQSADIIDTINAGTDDEYKVARWNHNSNPARGQLVGGDIRDYAPEVSAWEAFWNDEHFLSTYRDGVGGESIFGTSSAYAAYSQQLAGEDTGTGYMGALPTWLNPFVDNRTVSNGGIDLGEADASFKPHDAWKQFQEAEPGRAAALEAQGLDLGRLLETTNGRAFMYELTSQAATIGAQKRSTSAYEALGTGGKIAYNVGNFVINDIGRHPDMVVSAGLEVAPYLIRSLGPLGVAAGTTLGAAIGTRTSAALVLRGAEVLNRLSPATQAVSRIGRGVNEMGRTVLGNRIMNAAPHIAKGVARPFQFPEEMAKGAHYLLSGSNNLNNMKRSSVYTAMMAEGAIYGTMASYNRQSEMNARNRVLMGTDDQVSIFDMATEAGLGAIMAPAFFTGLNSLGRGVRWTWRKGLTGSDYLKARAGRRAAGVEAGSAIDVLGFTPEAVALDGAGKAARAQNTVLVEALTGGRSGLSLRAISPKALKDAGVSDQDINIVLRALASRLKEGEVMDDYTLWRELNSLLQKGKKTDGDLPAPKVKALAEYQAELAMVSRADRDPEMGKKVQALRQRIATANAADDIDGVRAREAWEKVMENPEDGAAWREFDKAMQRMGMPRAYGRYNMKAQRAVLAAQLAEEDEVRKVLTEKVAAMSADQRRELAREMGVDVNKIVDTQMKDYRAQLAQQYGFMAGGLDPEQTYKLMLEKRKELGLPAPVDATAHEFDPKLRLFFDATDTDIRNRILKDLAETQRELEELTDEELAARIAALDPDAPAEDIVAAFRTDLPKESLRFQEENAKVDKLPSRQGMSEHKWKTGRTHLEAHIEKINTDENRAKTLEMALARAIELDQDLTVADLHSLFRGTPLVEATDFNGNKLTPQIHVTELFADAKIDKSDRYNSAKVRARLQAMVLKQDAELETSKVRELIIGEERAAKEEFQSRLEDIAKVQASRVEGADDLAVNDPAAYAAEVRKALASRLKKKPEDMDAFLKKHLGAKDLEDFIVSLGDGRMGAMSPSELADALQDVGGQLGARFRRGENTGRSKLMSLSAMELDRVYNRSLYQRRSEAILAETDAAKLEEWILRERGEEDWKPVGTQARETDRANLAPIPPRFGQLRTLEEYLDEQWRLYQEDPGKALLIHDDFKPVDAETAGINPAGPVLRGTGSAAGYPSQGALPGSFLDGVNVAAAAFVRQQVNFVEPLDDVSLVVTRWDGQDVTDGVDAAAQAAQMQDVMRKDPIWRDTTPVSEDEGFDGWSTGLQTVEGQLDDTKLGSLFGLLRAVSKDLDGDATDTKGSFARKFVKNIMTPGTYGEEAFSRKDSIRKNFFTSRKKIQKLAADPDAPESLKALAVAMEDNQLARDLIDVFDQVGRDLGLEATLADFRAETLRLPATPQQLVELGNTLAEEMNITPAQGYVMAQVFDQGLKTGRITKSSEMEKLFKEFELDLKEVLEKSGGDPDELARLINEGKPFLARVAEVHNTTMMTLADTAAKRLEATGQPRKAQMLREGYFLETTRDNGFRMYYAGSDFNVQSLSEDGEELGARFSRDDVRPSVARPIKSKEEFRLRALKQIAMDLAADYEYGTDQTFSEFAGSDLDMLNDAYVEDSAPVGVAAIAARRHKFSDMRDIRVLDKALESDVDLRLLTHYDRSTGVKNAMYDYDELTAPRSVEDESTARFLEGHRQHRTVATERSLLEASMNKRGRQYGTTNRTTQYLLHKLHEASRGEGITMFDQVMNDLRYSSNGEYYIEDRINKFSEPTGNKGFGTNNTYRVTEYDPAGVISRVRVQDSDPFVALANLGSLHPQANLQWASVPGTATPGQVIKEGTIRFDAGAAKRQARTGAVHGVGDAFVQDVGQATAAGRMDLSNDPDSFALTGTTGRGSAVSARVDGSLGPVSADGDIPITGRMNPAGMTSLPYTVRGSGRMNLPAAQRESARVNTRNNAIEQAMQLSFMTGQEVSTRLDPSLRFRQEAVGSTADDLTREARALEGQDGVALDTDDMVRVNPSYGEEAAVVRISKRHQREAFQLYWASKLTPEQQTGDLGMDAILGLKKTFLDQDAGKDAFDVTKMSNFNRAVDALEKNGMLKKGEAEKYRDQADELDKRLVETKELPKARQTAEQRKAEAAYRKAVQAEMSLLAKLEAEEGTQSDALEVANATGMSEDQAERLLSDPTRYADSEPFRSLSDAHDSAGRNIDMLVRKGVIEEADARFLRQLLAQMRDVSFIAKSPFIANARHPAWDPENTVALWTFSMVDKKSRIYVGRNPMMEGLASPTVMEILLHEIGHQFQHEFIQRNSAQWKSMRAGFASPEGHAAMREMVAVMENQFRHLKDFSTESLYRYFGLDKAPGEQTDDQIEELFAQWFAYTVLRNGANDDVINTAYKRVASAGGSKFFDTLEKFKQFVRDMIQWTRDAAIRLRVIGERVTEENENLAQLDEFILNTTGMVGVGNPKRTGKAATKEAQRAAPGETDVPLSMESDIDDIAKAMSREGTEPVPSNSELGYLRLMQAAREAKDKTFVYDPIAQEVAASDTGLIPPYEQEFEGRMRSGDRATPPEQAYGEAVTEGHREDLARHLDGVFDALERENVHIVGADDTTRDTLGSKLVRKFVLGFFGINNTLGSDSALIRALATDHGTSRLMTNHLDPTANMVPNMRASQGDAIGATRMVRNELEVLRNQLLPSGAAGDDMYNTINGVVLTHIHTHSPEELLTDKLRAALGNGYTDEIGESAMRLAGEVQEYFRKEKLMQLEAQMPMLRFWRQRQFGYGSLFTDVDAYSPARGERTISMNKAREIFLDEDAVGSLNLRHDVFDSQEQFLEDAAAYLRVKHVQPGSTIDMSLMSTVIDFNPKPIRVTDTEAQVDEFGEVADGAYEGGTFLRYQIGRDKFSTSPKMLNLKSDLERMTLADLRMLARTYGDDGEIPYQTILDGYLSVVQGRSVSDMNVHPKAEKTLTDNDVIPIDMRAKDFVRHQFAKSRRTVDSEAWLKHNSNLGHRNVENIEVISSRDVYGEADNPALNAARQRLAQYFTSDIYSIVERYSKEWGTASRIQNAVNQKYNTTGVSISDIYDLAKDRLSRYENDSSKDNRSYNTAFRMMADNIALMLGAEVYRPETTSDFDVEKHSRFIRGAITLGTGAGYGVAQLVETAFTILGNTGPDGFILGATRNVKTLMQEIKRTRGDSVNSALRGTITQTLAEQRAVVERHVIDSTESIMGPASGGRQFSRRGRISNYVDTIRTGSADQKVQAAGALAVESGGMGVLTEGSRAMIYQTQGREVSELLTSGKLRRAMELLEGMENVTKEDFVRVAGESGFGRGNWDVLARYAREGLLSRSAVDSLEFLHGEALRAASAGRGLTPRENGFDFVSLHEFAQQALDGTAAGRVRFRELEATINQLDQAIKQQADRFVIEGGGIDGNLALSQTMQSWFGKMAFSLKTFALNFANKRIFDLSGVPMQKVVVNLAMVTMLEMIRREISAYLKDPEKYDDRRLDQWEKDPVGTFLAGALNGLPYLGVSSNFQDPIISGVSTAVGDFMPGREAGYEPPKPFAPALEGVGFGYVDRVARLTHGAARGQATDADDLRWWRDLASLTGITSHPFVYTAAGQLGMSRTALGKHSPQDMVNDQYRGNAKPYKRLKVQEDPVQRELREAAGRRDELISPEAPELPTSTRSRGLSDGGVFSNVPEFREAPDSLTD